MKLSPGEAKYRLLLYLMGYSDKEIALRVNRAPCTIRKWRLRNNLPKKQKYMRPKKFTLNRKEYGISYKSVLPQEKHELIKDFLIKLKHYANMSPAGKKINIGAFLKQYRDRKVV